MSVTVDEILEFAGRLAIGDTEMDWRDSTGRAYYAAYHHAKTAQDLCPSNVHIKMGDHERLHERYHMHDSKGAKSIALVLQDMKRHRRIADYEIEDFFEQSTAVNQVEKARRLVDRVNAFANTYRAKSA